MSLVEDAEFILLKPPMPLARSVELKAAISGKLQHSVFFLSVKPTESIIKPMTQHDK